MLLVQIRQTINVKFLPECNCGSEEKTIIFVPKDCAQIINCNHFTASIVLMNKESMNISHWEFKNFMTKKFINGKILLPFVNKHRLIIHQR